MSNVDAGIVFFAQNKVFHIAEIVLDVVAGIVVDVVAGLVLVVVAVVDDVFAIDATSETILQLSFAEFQVGGLLAADEDWVDVTERQTNQNLMRHLLMKWRRLLSKITFKNFSSKTEKGGRKGACGDEGHFLKNI